MAEVQIQTGYVDLQVGDGTTMAAYTARPEGDEAVPGLIVLQEAFGVNQHIRDVTERFARAGYSAVAPELFHRTAPGFEGSYTDFAAVMPHYQALTDDGLEADLKASYAFLDDGARPIATIGFCLGGKVSFLASMVLPIKAAACFYGGGIAPSERGPGLLSRTSEIAAPLLLCWGGKDGHIGPDVREQIESALIEAEKPYINAVFSKADHGFACDARASYDPESAQEALALARSFLGLHTAAA